METFKLETLYRVEFSLREPLAADYFNMLGIRDKMSAAANVVYINDLATAALEKLRLCNQELAVFAAPCMEFLQETINRADRFLSNYRSDPEKWADDPRFILLRKTTFHSGLGSWWKVRLVWTEYMMVLANWSEQIDIMTANIFATRDSIRADLIGLDDEAYYQSLYKARQDIVNHHFKAALLWKNIANECVEAEARRVAAQRVFWSLYYSTPYTGTATK